MIGENPEIKKLKKLLKKASPLQQQYAKELIEWLNGWLEETQSGPQSQSDPPGGNNPLPPPPPPRP